MLAQNQHPIRTIIKWFVVSKLVQYTIIFFTPRSQFDTSSSILLDSLPELDQTYWFNRLMFNKLLSWDSVFFVKNVIRSLKNGHVSNIPEYENEYAFSPFVWCSLLSKVLRMCTSGDTAFDEENATTTTTTTTSNVYILLVMVLFTNLLHFVSTIVLFFLTKLTFQKIPLYKYKESKVTDIALLTSILYVFSLSAGFQSTIYSEQLSAMLVFMGMYLRECSIIYNGVATIKIQYKMVYLLSTIFFTLAVWNRPNCIVIGVFYLWDISKLLPGRKRNLNFASLPRDMILPLFCGLTMVIGVIYMNYYIPYNIFCNSSSSMMDPVYTQQPFDAPTWCGQSGTLAMLWTPKFITGKSLYTYIQKEYWNIGFLKYFTANNIPNILIAIPSVCYLCISTQYFHGLKFNSFNLNPYCYMSLLFTLVMCGWAHVQIINRVITFIPLHLWFVAVNYSENREKRDTNSGITLSTIYIAWVIIWWPLQTVLFAAFLPPA